MTQLHTLYRPLTSRPFLKNCVYAEYAPSERLKPYIVCFWGTDESGDTRIQEEGVNLPESDRKVLVVPDTCIDIIIEINHTKQQITSRLCGIQDYTTIVNQKKVCDGISTFAVRFYFWAAHLFLDVNMKDICNKVLDLELVQPGVCADFEIFYYLKSMKERIAWMEGYLADKRKERSRIFDLYNSVYQMLHDSGRVSVKEICEYSCVSQRQMERLFQQEVGITIKRAATLVRYQNVWRDIVGQERFEIQEAVYRYGYSDQSHLLKEFKRFHGVLPEEAKNIAMRNR